MSSKPTGYDSASLARKLGIVEGCRIHVRGAPFDYARMLESLPFGVEFQDKVSDLADLIHLFCERKAALAAELEELRGSMRSDASVWVSWPKRNSKRPTDIIEDTIREIALPMGFVDVKVCAVDEIWSGLKLVIRKELRG